MTEQSRSETTLLHHRLDNGLEVIGQHIPAVESVAAVFWVKTGARDEEPPESGISHFLEHMAFKRSRTRTYVEFNREFEEIGAEDNAFTSVEMTAFHARMLGDQLPRGMELLADLTRPVLDGHDFDQERQVILEEIARHRDQPYSVLFDEFLRTFYPASRLGQPTLGTSESITGMRVENMRDYWRRRYGTENILFSVAGNFRWEAVLEQLGELTADWHGSTAGGRTAQPHGAAGYRVVADSKWNQQHLIIGVPSISRSDLRYHAAALLATILGDNTGSRLFWALNQTGLADQVGADAMTFSDSGLLLALAVTDPDKAPRALETVRSEMAKLQDGPIAAEELERAKTKLLTSTVLEGESTFARMLGLVDSWLAHERLETLDEVQASIESVSMDDIRRLLARYPLTEGQVITALGPLSAKELGAE